MIIVLGLLCSGNTYAKKNDIVIPKYFFANELTKKNCSLKGVHGYGSWGKAGWDLDLSITHVSKSKNPELQGNNYDPVSYTHLTLPTICSV